MKAVEITNVKDLSARLRAAPQVFAFAPMFGTESWIPISKKNAREIIASVPAEDLNQELAGVRVRAAFDNDTGELFLS